MKNTTQTIREILRPGTRHLFEQDGEEQEWIEIDGERYMIQSVWWAEMSVVEIETDFGNFVVAEDRESALDYVRDEFRKLRRNEIVDRVGVDTIIDMWMDGESIENYVEEYLAEFEPEAELATEDRVERQVTAVSDLFVEDGGFVPTVAYYRGQRVPG